MTPARRSVSAQDFRSLFESAPGLYLKSTSQQQLPIELRKKLSFETEIMMCAGRDLVRLAAGKWLQKTWP